MARQPRLVVPNVVHHVVARGVNGSRIFQSGFDKGRFLKRAARIAEQERVLVHGYCLMDNHVHFLLTPGSNTGLAMFMKRLNTWWAGRFNRLQKRSGHLFEDRYYSSPLSECHYWTALRYVELNAVRARIVKRAEDWPWSSARVNLRLVDQPLLSLTPPKTRASNDPSHWRELLNSDIEDADTNLRRATRSSKPCGPPSFVRDLEQKFGRRFTSRN